MLAAGGAGILLMIGPPDEPGMAAIFVAAVAITELLLLDFPDRRGVSLAALPVLLSAPLGPGVAVWSAGLGALIASLSRRSPRFSAFALFRATAAAAAAVAAAVLIAPGELGAPSPDRAAPPALLLAGVFAGISEGLTLLERRVGGATAPTRVDLLVSLGVVPLALASWVLVERIGQNGLAVAGAGLLALLVVVRSSVNASTRNADLERLSLVAQEVAASSTPAESLAALSRGLPPWVRVDQLWLNLPVPGEPPAVHTFGRANLLPSDLPLTPEIERLADEGPRPVPPELLKSRRSPPVLAARFGKGGVLLLAREGRAFNSDEEDVLGLLLGQLSAILEQVRLVDELERTMATLKETQQERDDFVSVMTHDLRQPLAGVLGYAQLLERGLRSADGDERLLKYARGIATGAERMMRMVSNLLEIARVESGRIEVDAALVKLEPLIGELVETLQAETEQKHQTVRVDVAADLPNLMTAEPLLRESLANLIGNAVKYTPEGGRIEVRARRVADQVEIQVADNGIGIPPDALPRIFGRFFRTGQPEVRELRGSGLGLALTKMMIEKIGGTIEVVSKLGEGTTFTVRFPPRAAASKERP